MSLKLITACFITLLYLPGCSWKNGDEEVKYNDVESESESVAEQKNSSDKELTGMLLVLDPEKCPLVEGCGPRFSLFGRKFETRVAIQGAILPEHHNMILTVVGPSSPLASNLVDKSGYENINAMIDVQKYRLRSAIPYYPFLVNAATKTTQELYECELLWDKSYSWTIEDNIPHISVRMTNTFSVDPQPWVELTYNGNTGDLIKADIAPTNMNPCAP